MNRKWLLLALPCLALTAFVSSWLGLGLLSRGVAAATFVFAVGTALATILVWVVADDQPWAAGLLGMMSHYAVAIAAFLVLGDEPRALLAGDANAALFVLAESAPGLAFASLAPVVARRWWDARAARQAPRPPAAREPRNLPHEG